MQPESRRFLKNGLANVVTGAGAAALSVGLPYFFVRALSQQEFVIWVLVLQVAAYVNFLNLGLQTAVGRYVALTLSCGDSEGPARQRCAQPEREGELRHRSAPAANH